MNVTRVADRLAASFDTGEPTDPVGAVSLADGYRVQEAVMERLTDRWGPVVGYKLGFTNPAVRREVGVDEPVFGRLTAEWVTDAAAVERVDSAEFVAPRAEPELVVRLADTVPSGASRATVAACVGGVAPTIEIVDSRTGQWDLTPGQAVADDALAARLVVGRERSLDALAPLSAVRTRITAGGVDRVGRGENVLGDPLRAVAWLADADGPLPADTLVSTGSTTETVPLADDGVRAVFEVPDDRGGPDESPTDGERVAAPTNDEHGHAGPADDGHTTAEPFGEITFRAD